MLQPLVLTFASTVFIIVIGSDNGECEQQGVSAAGRGEIESTICDTDNCRVGLSGWDHQITLNITCPYASVYTIASGSGHDVTINCFNCYISQRGALNIINNTDINTTTFNNIANCACSGITECQLSTTDDPCINSQDIQLSFKSTTKNEQYIECQKACYDNINNIYGFDCLYGIYYSYESQVCRFIIGACNWFDDIEDNEYHFVSKGCMSYPNGSFSAVSIPPSNNLESKSANNTIIIVIAVVVALCVLALVVIIFYRMRISNNKPQNISNSSAATTASKTHNSNQYGDNVNSNYKADVIQQQQYPIQQQAYVQPQQQQQGQMMMVKLPDGRTVMAQTIAPVQPVGNVVAYQPQPQPSAPVISHPDQNQQAPMYQPEGVNNNATFQ